MSIHFSDENVGLSSTAVRFDLPSGAAAKAANVACVFGCYFQTPELGWENSQPSLIAARQTGGTGGNDVYFRLNQACTQIDYRIRNGGSDIIGASSLTGLTAGVKYLFLFIVNPTYVHVIAAPVDGSTPLVASHNVSTVYSANMTSFAIIERIGGATAVGTSYGWVGPLENAFFLHGAFPESAGVPDNTLIVNLATGAQDIATLDAQLTSGVEKFWYPMRHNRDLSDAFGLLADLTTTNEVKATGLFHVNGRQIRPESVRPADAQWVVSQAVFGTPGDDTTATADVPVQGGTYTGISPAAMQARLVKEDGTTHVDWTTFATPAAGSWSAGVLADVPMVAGYLNLDIRAVDGGGSMLGNVVSGGVRGVGLHIIQTSQSQGTYWYETGSGLAITSGTRLVYMRQQTGARRALLGSASAINRLPRRGIRQAALEWNAFFPGVPCQFTTVGESGTPIDDFVTGGTHVGRWAALASRHGVNGPHIFAPMGHSQDADSGYEDLFDEMVGIKDAALGQAIKDVPLPVSRYKRAGATLTGNALAVHSSRLGMRRWHEANRSRSWWGSSFAPIHSAAGEVNSTSDPHPADTDQGQGRGGAIMAWTCMAACRAVPDEIVGITGASGLGTSTVTLTIGRINNPPA